MSVGLLFLDGHINSITTFGICCPLAGIIIFEWMMWIYLRWRVYCVSLYHTMNETLHKQLSFVRKTVVLRDFFKILLNFATTFHCLKIGSMTQQLLLTCEKHNRRHFFIGSDIETFLMSNEPF